MSMFHLPSVRTPKIKAGQVEIDPFINESLVDYLKQLRLNPTEGYTKLNQVCGRNEPTTFYKYVEVFQTFPFEVNSLHVMYSTENESAAKALTFVRGDKDASTANANQADLMVGTNEEGIYDFVRTALRSQKIGGNMVFQLSELFSLSTVHLLYLLSCCYTTVYVYAPMLYSGQTKFIVALSLHQNLALAPPPYDVVLSQLFLTKLIEINTMIGQKRLEQLRFNTNCEYECVIWKSKFLARAHNDDLYPDGRTNEVQKSAKTPYRYAVY